MLQGIKQEPQEGMRTSVSEIFIPTSEEMVADMAGGGWDAKSYDPLIDHYLTFAGLGNAHSLDFNASCLPENHTLL